MKDRSYIIFSFDCQGNRHQEIAQTGGIGYVVFTNDFLFVHQRRRRKHRRSTSPQWKSWRKAQAWAGAGWVSGAKLKVEVSFHYMNAVGVKLIQTLGRMSWDIFLCCVIWLFFHFLRILYKGNTIQGILQCHKTLQMYCSYSKLRTRERYFWWRGDITQVYKSQDIKARANVLISLLCGQRTYSLTLCA